MTDDERKVELHRAMLEVRQALLMIVDTIERLEKMERTSDLRKQAKEPKEREEG